MNDDVRSYYGRPVVKSPTWRPFIPAYFYLGGLAAGSSLLAAGADASGDRRLGLVTRCTALGAIGAGGVALVADLGRPERFHHMLRVVRPSSPMNVGSWVLAAYGPAVGVAAISEMTGVARPVGRLATWAAAALAPAVATYTAVLTSDTAIPAWHDVRSTLPALYAAGAAAASGGVATIVDPRATAARRLAIIGAAGEAVIASLLHRSLATDVARAYTSGRAHRLQRAATLTSAAGAALVATGGRRHRARARAGGALIAMGAACERFAVYEAGKASAADPRATIAPQRARL